jgi:hypothetical protein
MQVIHHGYTGEEWRRGFDYVLSNEKTSEFGVPSCLSHTNILLLFPLYSLLFISMPSNVIV